MSDGMKILGLFEAALAVALLVAAFSPVVCRLLKRRIEIHGRALNAFYGEYKSADAEDRSAREAARVARRANVEPQGEPQNAGPALWTRRPQPQEGQ